MDLGPLFNGTAWNNFLAHWGMHYHLSLVMYPESNSRAELGVKVARKANQGQPRPGQEPLCEQGNESPDLPAMLVFGRPISASLFTCPLKKRWTSQNHHKELGMAKTTVMTKEILDEHKDPHTPKGGRDHSDSEPD